MSRIHRTHATIISCFVSSCSKSRLSPATVSAFALTQVLFICLYESVTKLLAYPLAIPSTLCLATSCSISFLSVGTKQTHVATFRSFCSNSRGTGADLRLFPPRVHMKIKGLYSKKRRLHRDINPAHDYVTISPVSARLRRWKWKTKLRHASCLTEQFFAVMHSFVDCSLTNVFASVFKVPMTGLYCCMNMWGRRPWICSIPRFLKLTEDERSPNTLPRL